MIKIKDVSEFNGRDLPTDPGVYIFRDVSNEILYVGKAKSLRSRVRSYFSKSDLPIKTRQLVSKIRSIDWIIVNNEVEALLLENRLIKQHTPKYNISLKDSKTFAYIALTREKYPRVLTTRKVSARLEVYGPYTDGFMRLELQRLVARIFKLRICKTMPRRSCLNYHIGLCTAPCENKANAEEYRKQVEGARSFLKGNYEGTISGLKSKMKEASEHKKYERALEFRNQISSINLLIQHQIVDRERRFDQDVMAFRSLDEKMIIVQMGVRKGVLLGKKEFEIDMQPDAEQEFLKAFYTSNQIPSEILVSTKCWIDDEEKKAIEIMFSTKKGSPVKINVPDRGDKLSLVQLAEKNLESILKENVALVELQTSLNLSTVPKVIECFDVSNLGGEHIVSGMVRFTDARPDKKNYRKFKLNTVTHQDDFAALNEAVSRRYKRLLEENAPMPDLVMIDGGPAQLNAAKMALQSLGLQIPLISLAKENEEVYLPDDWTPIKFDKNGKMMTLLRQIRDATHNFSISYNRKRRQMKMRNEFK